MAGEFVVTVNKSCNYGSFKVGGANQQIKTANSILEYSQEIPANTTDYQVDFPVVLAQVQAITVDSTQDGCIITTNAPRSGSPDNTLNLDALTVLHWDISLATGTRFVTSDVSSIYISTGSKATIIHIGVALAASV